MPTIGAAQEPVASFDQLNTRLKVDMVWVTNNQGRETQGKVQRITVDALTLNGSRIIDVRDVSLVRYREHDSLKNGTLIGLGIGGSLGLTWCLAAATDDSPDVSTGVECTEGLVVYGGLGTFACPYASLGFLRTSRFETQPPFADAFQQLVELW